MTRYAFCFAWFALSVALVASPGRPAAAPAAPEPSVEVASQWWHEMPNVWTPVGWKNHLFRFNVLHTGTIVAEPHPASPFGKKHTEAFAGQGVQLAFIPSADGAIPAARGEPYQLTDANANLTGRQGWTNHATPVLWTEWRQPHLSLNGITLKLEVFGHIAGAADVQHGDEPLWISKYPRTLSAEPVEPAGGAGAGRPGSLLTEAGGKVRLVVLAGGAEAVTFIDKTTGGGLDYYLHVTLPARKGGNFHQPAVLVRKMSSCEPCYSWNIYHAWQSRDRGRFLEGMYSLITGGMSRQTFISSEHRGGISSTHFVAPLAVSLLRLAAIDDEIEPGHGAVVVQENADGLRAGESELRAVRRRQDPRRRVRRRLAREAEAHHAARAADRRPHAREAQWHDSTGQRRDRDPLASCRSRRTIS